MDDFDEMLIKNAKTGEEEAVEEAPTETAEVADQETSVDDVTEQTDVVEQTEEELNESEASSEEDSDSPEETTNVEEEIEDKDLVFEDWDTVEDDETQEAVVKPTAEVLKELGFDGLTVEQAKAKIKEIQDAGQSDPLTNVPDSLKDAIKLAQNDGDWLQFLQINQVDYNSIDNDVLLANSLAQHFTDESGVLDREALDDYMDGMDEVDKTIRAKQLKANLIQAQQVESQRIQAEAAQRREQADKELRAALDRAEEIRGFKLKPANKKKIYEGVTTGQMIQDMFMDKNGKMDFNKVIDAYFNHLYGKQADSYLKQRITSSTKKAMLNKIGNVSTTPKPGQLADTKPEAYNPQKELVKDLMGA